MSQGQARAAWRGALRERWRLRPPLRLRLFFRAAFALLSLASVALALSMLREEKQLALRSYADGLHKNLAQISARLRHPSGQLALLNPQLGQQALQPANGLAPLLLPFGAIDFDDRGKAQQAVEMAGCAVQYPHGQLCVAVGNNPLAGGFVYVVGQFESGPLQPRLGGSLDWPRAHRARIELDMRDQRYVWIAPFEGSPAEDGKPQAGRLTGFALPASGATPSRPLRDFRGWLWQDARCLAAAEAEGTGTERCRRRSFFSVRLPVTLLQDEILSRQPGHWPPRDLAQMRLRLQILAPGAGAPLFDSGNPDAVAPFALSELRALLLPGEQLGLRRLDAKQDLLRLQGEPPGSASAPVWLTRLIDRLPPEAASPSLRATEWIDTAFGRYEIAVQGSQDSINASLAAVALRNGAYVLTMLVAILLTWLAIELSMMRRIALLTRRAAALRLGVRGMQDGDGPLAIDLADLRGRDELGLLGGVLDDLLKRVNEDLRRAQIRAEQEKDQWHAVGHEIMSPLQSLMALHGDASDPSHRYISRMQQAVRVLYGSASPSEAFQATQLQLGSLDLNEFLSHVAVNAPAEGIADVSYRGSGEPALALVDEFALEDVLTHLLRNAQRHREPGSAIQLTLMAEGESWCIAVFNRGHAIPEDLLERIFEYGVHGAGHGEGQRGQGLFVAKTYMAKMGGTISAHNGDGGVLLRLQLPRSLAQANSR
ncbi:HAMP domain-containing sensor histidine kinase [Paucibacter sp. APW11]|uniref:histidine kinase n=1 Tax=Roseateles aquae TaxID=3077235 RepID=A0ABU3PCG7_9BURK|nr:HAMP domain-containing sensor histidine kinase [Paucibacter sp. APW11]MDT8999848.1 HAMP domain-containing sensor histidine kinase [Paucibacter sp. APW11]